MWRQGESKVIDEGTMLSSPFFVLARWREGGHAKFNFW